MTYKKKHRFQEWYGDLKLQSKFTLALTLIVVIPAILVAVFFYSQLYDMVVSNTIRKEQEISSKTAPLIEETVSQVTDTYEELASLSFFKTIFHNPVSTPLGELTHTQDAEDFRKRVNEIADKDPVNAIRIYLQTPASQNSLFVSENTRDTFLPMSSARGTYWYGIFQGSHVTELFCPPFYLGTKERENCGDLAYIRKISINYYNNVYDAYVVLYYSSSAFEKILSDNLALSGSVSYIINDRNSTVASSNDSLSGIYWLDYESIQDAFMSSNNFVEQNILGETVYAGFYSITEPKWYMVTILPSQPLINQSNQIILQLLGIYLAILIFAIVLANFLARSITNRLSSVISQMKKVRQGPPVPMESPQAHDEIGDLIDTYNYMTRKMDELIQKQAKASEDLRIAEFNSLQAQINPHFLYNTLDSLYFVAIMHGDDQMAEMVEALSDNFKLALNNGNKYIKVADSVKWMQGYMKLQNMRYNNRFELFVDISREILQRETITFIFQPFIENAMYHGLEPKIGKGKISLRGWQEQNDMIFTIEDDGVGIDDMSRLENGYGVRNVIERIKLNYGEKYGVTFESSPGKGTKVTIVVPVK